MATDWLSAPTVSHEIPDCSDLPLHRQMLLFHRTLDICLREGSELVLLLEDDLVFNVHLRHNLMAWRPLRRLGAGEHFFASLFNPGTRLTEVNPSLAYAEIPPESASGSQALLISRRTVAYLTTCWGMLPAMHADLKLAKLAARVGPLLCHVPSLVQHVGFESVWGGPFSAACDFDRSWRAP
jgi:hypothetical protein